MKLSKSDLKAIVKECLVEILNEGLGGIAPAPAKSAIFDNKKNSNQRFYEATTAQKAFKPTQSLKAAITQEAGGNKIMEAILADTAAKSLPSMLENDRPGAPMMTPGGTAERVVAAADPQELFGEEAASKWASLAFADSAKK